MSPRELAGKQVLVLGLGDTGFSMARHLARHGARVRVADSRDDPPMAGALSDAVPDAVLHTGAFREASFAGIDLLAISPGVDARQSLIHEAAKLGTPIVGDVELFAWALAALGDSPKVIGITGSNGKTTVTSMVGEMCRAAGLSTVIAGNIGLPVLDALRDAERDGFPQAFVLELSSFQLETSASLRLASASVLNLSEDHMDRYASLADYAAAKARIFANAAVRVVNRDDAASIAMAPDSPWSFGLSAPAGAQQFGLLSAAGDLALAEGGEALMPLADLPLAGLHNAANALAALALTRALGLPREPLLAALRRFRGLPHRVEKVATVAGVTWYDDSKGTNVGATEAALRGFRQPVVLIAGGDGKGQDFSPLADAVAARARAVVLIGRDAPLIESVITVSRVPIHRAATLQAAVELAATLAEPGDAVLLSPACASFDMFRNYLHRAEVFCAAVHALAGREANHGA